MRRFVRMGAAGAALLLLAGCSGDAVVDGDGAGSEEAAAAETAEADGDGGDEPAGEELAEGRFNGEEIAFSGASCGTLFADNEYEVRGRIEGGGHLQARFEYDPDASEGDDVVLVSEQPHRLDLFFPGEGGTIGDGEGYEARSGLGGIDASATHMTGSVELEPDDATRAPEINPDGGTVEFQIACG